MKTMLGPERVCLLAIVALLMGIAVPTLDAAVVSGFDSDNEGWQVVELGTGPTSGDYRNITFGPYTPYWNGTGGSPDGHIYTNDRYGNEFYFQAPSEFLGNQSGYYGATLSWCVKSVPDAGSTPAFWPADVVLVSPEMVLVNFDPAPATPSWEPRSVSLDEGSGWIVGTYGGAPATAAEITNVLSDLTAVRILGEFYSGTELGYLDSVVLPEPATLSILGLGALALIRRRRDLVSR